MYVCVLCVCVCVCVHVRLCVCEQMSSWFRSEFVTNITRGSVFDNSRSFAVWNALNRHCTNLRLLFVQLLRRRQCSVFFVLCNNIGERYLLSRKRETSFFFPCREGKPITHVCTSLCVRVCVCVTYVTGLSTHLDRSLLPFQLLHATLQTLAA